MQTKIDASRILGSPRRLRLKELFAVGLMISLAALFSVAVTIFFQGRADPLRVTRGWLAMITAAFVPSVFWLLYINLRLNALSTGKRGGRAIALNTLLSTLLVIVISLLDIALYISDNFHHVFTSEETLRRGFGIGTIVTIYLFMTFQATLVSWAGNGATFYEATISKLRNHGEPIAILALSAIGVLLGGSYITVMGDDYARYWTIADALAQGLGYAASEVGEGYQAGGMSRYLVDLPGLPLAMLISFTLIGHNVLAAMLPAILAASLFPLVAYLTFKELTHNVVLSYVFATILATFPLFSFYVLRAAEPDGMFMTLLMAMAFFAIRCDRHPRSTWLWVAFGITAGIVTLTRPEGVMYAGISFLTMFFAYRAIRGYWIAAGFCGCVIAPFSVSTLLTFSTPWPTSFVGTVQLQHISQNLDGFFVSALPNYASALGTTQTTIGLLAVSATLLYVAGTHHLLKKRPQLLFIALLPAMSVLTFLLVSPALTRPELPYDYFRRASYGLPFFSLIVSYPISLIVNKPLKTMWKSLALSLLVVGAVAVVSYENRLSANPELIYEGGTQILTSGRYILATDLLANPYDLPLLQYEKINGVLLVDDSFDYMDFRTRLNRYFEPWDLHGSDRARNYATASLAVFLIGLVYALLAIRKQNGQPKKTLQR